MVFGEGGEDGGDDGGGGVVSVIMTKETLHESCQSFFRPLLRERALPYPKLYPKLWLCSITAAIGHIVTIKV